MSNLRDELQKAKNQTRHLVALAGIGQTAEVTGQDEPAASETPLQAPGATTISPNSQLANSTPGGGLVPAQNGLVFSPARMAVAAAVIVALIATGWFLSKKFSKPKPRFQRRYA